MSKASEWKRREDALLAKIVSIEPMAAYHDRTNRVRGVDEAIAGFFQQVGAGKIDIYNEFSLQHELGIFLRSAGGEYSVQFERPVGYFGFRSPSPFAKKEIDIAIVSTDQSVRIAIELKYPRNGQYPEQMFKFCQDICFLE